MHNAINLEFEILPKLKSPAHSLMLFGSFARGDASDHSDIDVLQLMPHSRAPYRIGAANISVYSPDSLSALAQSGSLFILHLLTDGRILRDDFGWIHGCLELYKRPNSYDQLYAELRCTAKLLDVDEKIYILAWKQLNDTALYLLRSCLFANMAEKCDPCFSISRIAEVVGDPGLLEFFTLKYDLEPNWNLYRLLRIHLEGLLKIRINNPYITVEALMVNHQDVPSLVVFGTRILARQDVGFAYGIAP